MRVPKLYQLPPTFDTRVAMASIYSDEVHIKGYFQYKTNVPPSKIVTVFARGYHYIATRFGRYQIHSSFVFLPLQENGDHC